MKAEDIERLRNQQIPDFPGIPQGVPDQPGQPPHAAPRAFPSYKIRVSTTSTDEGDRKATEQLLNSCFDQGIYQCPRCDFSTADQEKMVHHLADEINASMQALAAAYTNHPPKKAPGSDANSSLNPHQI